MHSHRRPIALVPSFDKGLQQSETSCLLAVNNAPWPKYKGNISVLLALEWTPQALICHWQVREPSVLARFTRANDPVYQDSCVEAFLSFPGADEYINIECNAIGTVLAARGKNRHERSFLTLDEMARLGMSSSLGREPIEREIPLSGPWSLEMTLPFDLIPGCPSRLTPGTCIMANFYKCGDNLSIPHYYTWAPVLAEKPDFHRAEFFGTLILI